MGKTYDVNASNAIGIVICITPCRAMTARCVSGSGNDLLAGPMADF